MKRFHRVLAALLVVVLCVIGKAAGGNFDFFLNQGDESLASNDFITAIQHYKEATAQIQEVDSIISVLSLYTNLATALSASGDEFEAVKYYRDAILYHSEHIEHIVDDSERREASNIAAQAAFFLGMTHEELKNYRKAADSYAYAASLDEYHWASYANLGAILQDHLKESAEALAVYNKALDILTQRTTEPTDPPEYPELVLSQLHYRIGLAITYAEKQKCVRQDNQDEVPCKEMAANSFKLAIELDPNNEEARHMLASVTADATFTRASNTYVTKLFEDYAGNFEHSLVQELGYDGFQRLRKAFDKALEGEGISSFKIVVDAGCGTGLVGEQFRNVSDYLVGVDLSPSILEEAQRTRPGLYDEVIVGDVTEVFRAKAPLSMIIAADSYIYFGDLVPLFESMEQSVAESGILAFTLEDAPDDMQEQLSSIGAWRWQLQPSGRFAHNKDYIKQVGSSHSFETIYYESMRGFRHEVGVPVNGHIFIMRKMPSNKRNEF
jgi:predicted TPR repeat methyltransferase/Flp pilus assembly protein TadD